jgi:hypothetical protein
LPGSPAIDAGANDPLGTLTLAVTATATTFSVNNAGVFTPGMYLKLGAEIVLVTAIDAGASTLTVKRHMLGTLAAVHASATNLFLATDQRGVIRPRDGDGNGSKLVDIGAFER